VIFSCVVLGCLSSSSTHHPKITAECRFGNQNVFLTDSSGEGEDLTSFPLPRLSLLTDTAVGRKVTPESWKDDKPTDLQSMEVIKVQEKM